MGLHLIALAYLQTGFTLHPDAASTTAGDVDHLYYALTAMTLFFTVGIFATIFYFMLKYRRRSEAIPPATRDNLLLEATWIVIPAIICVVIFFWASRLYFRNAEPPPGATEVFVVGKQWMWQLQHASGQREINELHIPVGVPVKLTMTSQDVIHDFSVPAFRVKMDVLPGRYTSEWFQAEKAGAYHLFCAQYCGTLHSGMTGWIYVMEPRDFAQWLQDHGNGESMGQTGEHLFAQFSCAACHAADGTGSGPSLQSVYGRRVTLQSGETRVVDDAFIHQAIVDPNSVAIQGYPQIMPAFQGQLKEDQILQLIAFIKSLGAKG